MNDDTDLFEKIRLYLPKYLTPEQTRQLFQELRSFPDNFAYYLVDTNLQDSLMQGDGWQGFVVINFETLEKKTVSGVILSNSCDIDNESPTKFNVLFSPIIKLSRFSERLLAAGKTEEQLSSTLDDIRRQRVTSMFFLPSMNGVLDYDSVVLLDDIHGHPIANFRESTHRQPLFTLSQYGFYLLLLKLSIHFTRFQEDVSRF